MKRWIGSLAALWLVAAAPGPLTIDASTVGRPGSDAVAELFPIAGSGPYPAMVVLHTCGGVDEHIRDWARRLVSWGYVAIMPDSFRPRGVHNVCNQGREVPPELRAADAFAAAAYLRTLPNVRPDRIGVIGFSHGGWTVMTTVLADTVAQDGGRPFAAGVAYYPACPPPRSPLATDTLILIGQADDWTPAARCERWRDTAQTDGHTLLMTEYPGVLHSFDAVRPTRVYLGHHLGYDAAAAGDAFGRTKAFLDERLRR